MPDRTAIVRKDGGGAKMSFRWAWPGVDGNGRLCESRSPIVLDQDILWDQGLIETQHRRQRGMLAGTEDNLTKLGHYFCSRAASAWSFLFNV